MADTEKPNDVIVVDNAESGGNHRTAIFIVCIVIAVIIFIAHYVLSALGYCSAGDEAFTAQDYFIKKFLPQLGNATLVFSLLWYFGWPMLETMVSDRKKKIEHDIDECARVKAEAEASMAEVNEKLENLSAEKARMTERYAETTREEGIRIREDAEHSAARLARDAEIAFELHAHHTRHVFELEVVNLAVDKARNEIINKLAQDEALRNKLIDDSIASLEL